MLPYFDEEETGAEERRSSLDGEGAPRECISLLTLLTLFLCLNGLKPDIDYENWLCKIVIASTIHWVSSLGFLWYSKLDK